MTKQQADRPWRARAGEWILRRLRWAAARGTETQRLLSTLVAGGAGVVAVAIAGLAVEHVFEDGWTGPVRGPYPFWLTVSLLVWLLAFEWRLYLSRAVGTLYHVRMMPASLRNWHLETQEIARRKYLRIVRVLRGVNLAAEAGVIDLRTDIAAVEDKLLDLVNADDDQTGYTIAPDILAPAAIALGYRVTVPPGTVFHDFGDQGRDNGFEWNLEDRPTSGFRDVTTGSAAGGGPVGIHIHAAFSGVTEYAPLQQQVRLRLHVGVIENGDLAPAQVGITRGRGLVHPLESTEEWVRTIRQALHEARKDEPVVITARVPKTVSLAAGYLLSPSHRSAEQLRSFDPGCGDECCQNPACRNPWHYLLPLNYNQGTKLWEPVWLLPEQRDPRELLALLEAAQ